MTKKPYGRANSQTWNRRNKPWFDKECRVAKAKLHQTASKCLRDHSNAQNRPSYVEVQNNYRWIIARRKKKYSEIIKERFPDLNLPIYFWRAVKKLEVNNSNATALPIERWNEFHDSAYPPRDPYVASVEFVGDTVPALDEEINLYELQKTLKKCKNGEAVGPNGVTNKFYKALPDEGLEYLLGIFNQVLVQKYVPQEWSKVTLTMLFMKGDKEDPLNFREIGLVNNVTKICTQLLKVRLERSVKGNGLLTESQMGFRKRRSCTDCIFTFVLTVQLQFRLGQREVYAIFVDFKRAFDSIPHKWLWAKLLTLEVSPKLTRIIKSLYNTLLTSRIILEQRALSQSILTNITICLC